MAPRNNDADAGYQKNACTDDRDVDINKTLPCLTHKKHKVVKLVKSQLLKIQQEGLLTNMSGTDLMLPEYRSMQAGAGPSKRERMTRMAGSIDNTTTGTPLTSGHGRGMGYLCHLLVFIIGLAILILLMVWISAGPLSNSIAHTPIPQTAFVRTDSICSLEKKYLLRWSKPDYFE